MKWNWENNLVLDNPSYPYSRFIASWTYVCIKEEGTVRFDDRFKDWLRSIGVPEDDVYGITEMATEGRLELQEMAKRFLKGS